MDAASVTAAVTHPTGLIPRDQRKLSSRSSWPRIVRGSLAVLQQSVWRQLRSWQTLVAMVLLCLAIALAWALTLQRSPTPRRFAMRLLIPVYLSFLMPIFAVGYGASSLGSEREEGTLTYLFATPLPRPWLYVIKFVGTQLVVLSLSMASLAALCFTVGEIGKEVWPIFWPASLLAAGAYTALFMLLGSVFRFGTIISLAYWFFLEVTFGNLPGQISRLSIAYYAKCLIYEGPGKELRLGPQGPQAQLLFQPVPVDQAFWTLTIMTGALLLLGLWLFQRREYHET
jgi:ABC-2 type transport system permease protein